MQAVCVAHSIVAACKLLSQLTLYCYSCSRYGTLFLLGSLLLYSERSAVRACAHCLHHHAHGWSLSQICGVLISKVFWGVGKEWSQGYPSAEKGHC